jgi:hypothetical protein
LYTTGIIPETALAIRVSPRASSKEVKSSTINGAIETMSFFALCNHSKKALAFAGSLFHLSAKFSFRLLGFGLCP